MKRTVRFLPEALEDLSETQNWYASREPGLGQAFAEAIAAADRTHCRPWQTMPQGMRVLSDPGARAVLRHASQVKPFGSDGWRRPPRAAASDHATTGFFIFTP